MKARTVFWLVTALLIAIAAIPFPLKVQVMAQVDGTPPAIVKTPAALAPDLAFGRFIALIRGHLLTGDALVKQRAWESAQPHFMFPLEEIYGVIREDLRTYKTPPFDSALKALVRTVGAHSAKEFPKARQRVEDALAAADAGLKARQPNWPRFVVETAIAVLKTAPDEYEDAVAKDRIVRPIGYQTARGFILQADRMIESVAGEIEAKNVDALRDLREAFALLKQACAAVTAPKRPPIDNAAMIGMVSRIEQAAGRLM